MTALLIVVGVAAAALATLVFGRWYWGRRIARWAREQGLTLVEYRGARFYEGPRAWLRAENEFAFQIVIRDGSGRERRGWLTFGSMGSVWPTSRASVRRDG